MRAYLKASLVALSLLVSGVLVSPSAQVQIQIAKAFSWVSGATARLAANGNTYDITLAEWGTTLSTEGNSYATGTIVFLGTAPIGQLTVVNVENGGYGVFALRGAVNAAVEMADSLGAFSITKDTPTSVNVYYDAAGASGAGYYLQQNVGATRTLRIVLIGA